MQISALTTDFYELTMMQGYFLNKHNPNVVFDMFYRTNPFEGGYVIFAGLHELIDKLESLCFSEEDIAYLKSLGKFTPEFLSYLADYHFSGDLYAMEEGTVVFPGEPLLRIHTNLIEAQLIEGLLLNTINFQSLIATKASRMLLASKQGLLMEFGLRRAQGSDGALSASRAAFIGGCQVTSNTLAGKEYNIPVAGTMAHSWIMSFQSELESFRAYANLYPDNTVLLIDTYDTLGSGIDNAIIVGLEQKQKGKKIGVRIDSGDLSYLPRVIRKRLDAAGLEDATIVVSNDLTEAIVQTLVLDGVPIDSWGIGTHLVTGGSQSSLNGVYKLAAKEGDDGHFIPTMKISNSFEKTTNPGIKQVYRFSDDDAGSIADLITLEKEKITPGRTFVFYHPFAEADFFEMQSSRYTHLKPLINKQMEGGKRIGKKPNLQEIQNYVQMELNTFHKSYLRQINPHIYKVSLSSKLKKLKMELLAAQRKKTKEGL
ncbi:nicotinate phosphoribosyltransferase [Sphaerochaeta halotolerans]|jgi:nicotinate phosphoribosyltransferase|uniref:nicotinate phosphoribosyltransferase n=1 Tax=Sphaerochaeta halotolerans TaxID=2293840 RepID=UPI00137082AC|nr:nicotinate phosphoribosyltransferase [Sphaerochaeta halotolerans]MBG0766683.1 nicotinate phosphoribosyltransferase [Spirochaetaceae bacterium]MDK2860412.1 nicotinate phosphoribosyltransferase [Sphaerochaeta sp.]MDN5332865.1 nicotinate phosphoribosyltransferase [Sphaerochaeta sp.]MXI85618.1 nicotinate phosphoribosyltransferase [Sphaerochaeta halotolerans]